MLKIGILTNRPFVKQALINLFVGTNLYLCMVGVSNLDELIDAFSSLLEVPDVMLLDIPDAGYDGNDVLEWLHVHHAGMKIIALSLLSVGGSFKKTVGEINMHIYSPPIIDGAGLLQSLTQGRVPTLL